MVKWEVIRKRNFKCTCRSGFPCVCNECRLQKLTDALVRYGYYTSWLDQLEDELVW